MGRPFGSGQAGGVRGRMFATAVGAVGRGRRTAARYGAEVALLRARWIGAAMFCPLVVESTDGACGMVLFAYGGSVSIALAVAAASGFVSRVGGFNLPFAGEEEDVGAHSFAVFRGSSDYH